MVSNKKITLVANLNVTEFIPSGIGAFSKWPLSDSDYNQILLVSESLNVKLPVWNDEDTEVFRDKIADR